MRFVRQKGIDLVNRGLQDLETQQGLRNPPGWLVRRVDELEQGAGPLAAQTSRGRRDGKPGRYSEEDDDGYEASERRMVEAKRQMDEEFAQLRRDRAVPKM